MFLLPKSRTRARRPRQKPRTLRFEPLEVRALLAIDSFFDNGRLTVSSDADDAITVRVENGLVKINDADPVLGPVAANDVTELSVHGGPDSQLINVRDINPAAFPSIELTTFRGGTWVDPARAEAVIDEILGPGWSDKLGIADMRDYLVTGAWKEPLASGQLARQISDAGWGNAQELLDRIVGEVGQRAVVHTVSWGAFGRSPLGDVLFNGSFAVRGQKVLPAGAAQASSTAAMVGDINADGTVDGADYTLWANSYGDSGDDLPADLNSDGVVGDRDYHLWVDNYGLSADLAASGTGETAEPDIQGDINVDGTVDGADYTLWANSFGDIGDDLPADLNSDGVVGDRDYHLWVDNYGLSADLAGEFRQFRGAAGEGILIYPRLTSVTPRFSNPSVPVKRASSTYR